MALGVNTESHIASPSTGVVISWKRCGARFLVWERLPVAMLNGACCGSFRKNNQKIVMECKSGNVMPVFSPSNYRRTQPQAHKRSK